MGQNIRGDVVLLEQITAAYQAEDYERARELANEYVAQAPDDSDGWMFVAIIAMVQGRIADATQSFERKLQLAPDPWAYTQLGFCYWKLGELDRALHCYSAAEKLQPTAETYEGLANVLHGMHRFHEALAKLDVAERIAPHSPDIQLRRGCTLLELARFDAAGAALARALEYSSGESIARLIATDRATFESLPAAEPVAKAPAFARTPSATFNPSGVVLVSFDPAYARRFGFPFIRSFGRNAASNLLLHVHVLDPDEAIVDEVTHVASSAGVGSLAVTTEATPLPASKPNQRRAYYATARFVHLPQLLERYRMPILSLDSDLIVESSLTDLIHADSGVDLLLNERDPITSPWLDIVANVLVAYPTRAAAAYFRRVGAYAMRYIMKDPQPWFIDQIALSCVLKMMDRFATLPRIHWKSNAHEAGLWHIGHSYGWRLDDPRFKAYV